VHADNLRRAHDVVRRTTIFTTRLLVLSQGQPFQPTSVVLNRTVRELLPEIRALVKPPAAVDSTIGADGGCVAISASNLREVLMPLAANASEAMEHGGRLTIETGWVDLDPQEAIARAVRPGRYGRVVVRDTGVGMPRDVLAHLYEPFFTTKAKPRNRGLGLATAYVVVTQHGGGIAVTSELGAGTTVEVLIPTPLTP
jgi:signal transduction histidine kinase